MRALFIEPTSKTPAINFDEGESILHIIGRSIPEDPERFYTPMMDWIREYLLISGNDLELQVVLEYINSGSTKYILEVLRELEDLSGKTNQVSVQWCYESGDDSIMELGEHFKDVVPIPIKLVEIE